MNSVIGQSLRTTVICTCLLFVWFMGVNGLSRVPLATHDEARTLVHVFGYSLDTPQPLDLTVASVADESAQHGPLYFVLLNVWAGLTGADLFTLRLLSVYGAVLSVAATSLLAGLTRSDKAACAAAAILALNWLFIFYARELRMYTLAPALVAWNIWCYWRVSQTNENVTRRVWLGLVVSAALMVYLHYFAFFVLVAIGAYHGLFARKGRSWFGVAVAYAIAGAVFMPWLPVVLTGFRQFSGKALSAMGTAESVASILAVYSNEAWMIAAALDRCDLLAQEAAERCGAIHCNADRTVDGWNLDRQYCSFHIGGESAPLSRGIRAFAGMQLGDRLATAAKGAVASSGNCRCLANSVLDLRN